MTKALVQLSGPILEGRAPMIVDDWMRSNLDLIGTLAVDVVRGELDVVLQNPTGYYRSHIQAASRFNAASTFDVVVDDQGVIYGPWLAGTGSRNYPVTRFKGYAHWRRSAQKIGELARQTTVGTLRQLVRKLGG